MDMDHKKFEIRKKYNVFLQINSIRKFFRKVIERKSKTYHK